MGSFKNLFMGCISNGQRRGGNGYRDRHHDSDPGHHHGHGHGRARRYGWMHGFLRIDCPVSQDTSYGAQPFSAPPTVAGFPSVDNQLDHDEADSRVSEDEDDDDDHHQPRGKKTGMQGRFGHQRSFSSISSVCEMQKHAILSNSAGSNIFSRNLSSGDSKCNMDDLSTKPKSNKNSNKNNNNSNNISVVPDNNSKKSLEENYHPYQPNYHQKRGIVAAIRQKYEPVEKEAETINELETQTEADFNRLYRKGEIIGSGATSIVHVAYDRVTEKPAALKTLFKKRAKKDVSENILREVSYLRKLSNKHPNVASLLPNNSIFETSSHFLLLMEFCEGGELLKSIIERGHYSEVDAIEVMKQVVSAIAFCHEKGIVHRDLKPENLLLKDKSQNSIVMVSDFGMSRIVSYEGEIFDTACGTPLYCAPEVYQKRGHGKPCDMWSLGCIVYVLLSGCAPFYNDNMVETVRLICNADYSFPTDYWCRVSRAARDFIAKLLVQDPAHRMTAQEALDDPWLTIHPSLLPFDSDSALDFEDCIDFETVQCEASITSDPQSIVSSQIESTVKEPAAPESVASVPVSAFSHISKTSSNQASQLSHSGTNQTPFSTSVNTYQTCLRHQPGLPSTAESFSTLGRRKPPNLLPTIRRGGLMQNVYSVSLARNGSSASRRNI